MFRRTVEDWLACPAQGAGAAQAEWSERGIAVLPLGKRFEAVRLPESLVHAAVRSSSRPIVGDVLAEALDGAVIHDSRGRNYYAIVPLDTILKWRSKAAGAECLGDGTHLGVPSPDREEPCSSHPIYWAVPPMEAGDTCDPASVALLTPTSPTSAA